MGDVPQGGQPAIVPSEAEMKAIREYRASLKEGFAEQSAALGEEAIKEEEQRQQVGSATLCFFCGFVNQNIG